MIQSFRCKDTEKLYQNIPVKRFLPIEKAARKKLKMLNAAIDLNDLLIPPGNRLEALKREQVGRFSIRINEQYRICFIWKEHQVYEVEIVDYH